MVEVGVKGKVVGNAGTLKLQANGGKQGDNGYIVDTDLGAVGCGVVDKLGEELCKPDFKDTLDGNSAMVSNERGDQVSMPDEAGVKGEHLKSKYGEVWKKEV